MGYQDCPYQRRSTQPTKNFAYHPKFNEIGQARSLPKIVHYGLNVADFQQAHLIGGACWYWVVLECSPDLRISGEFDKHANPKDGKYY